MTGQDFNDSDYITHKCWSCGHLEEIAVLMFHIIETEAQDMGICCDHCGGELYGPEEQYPTAAEAKVMADDQADERRKATPLRADEKCAWCGERGEDGLGYGWPVCSKCGELYGMQTPPSHRAPKCRKCETDEHVHIMGMRDGVPTEWKCINCGAVMTPAGALLRMARRGC